MPYRKTIAKPDLGIDWSAQPFEIPTRSWVTMTQMRSRVGKVSNFPGWASILSAISRIDGNLCTLLGHYQQFDGTTFLIVGGATKLYRYVVGTKSLTDISGAVYATTRDNPWWPFFFLNNYYVTNFIDGMRKFTGGGNFSAVANSPKAKAAIVLNDHIIVLNYIDGTGTHHQGIKWAAEGTDTDWLATSQNDAGQFDFLDSAEEGVGFYKLGNDGIVYLQRSIIPITFVGGNEVFGARQTIEGVGLIGQEALADLPDRHIFMGNNAFYAYAGGVTLDDKVGLKVRDLVYNNLHPVFKNRSKALYNENTNEVMFMYPSSSSQGECDTCVILNTVDDSWYGPFPIPVTAVGTTFRSLSQVINQINIIINQDNDIINSNINLQKSPLILFGDALGDIHSIGESQSANGVPLTRILETGDQFLGADAQVETGVAISLVPSTVYMITSINLELENIAPNEPIQMFVGVRMELDAPISYKGPYVIYSHSSQRARVPVRATGRWARLRFVLPNNARLGLLAYQYEYETMGVR